MRQNPLPLKRDLPAGDKVRRCQMNEPDVLPEGFHSASYQLQKGLPGFLRRR